MISAKAICAAALSLGSSFTGNPQNICKWAPLVIQESAKYDIDPYLVVGLIQAESNWRRDVVSACQACGLMQVLEKYSKYNCTQLKNPKTNIKVGIKKLDYWINNYGKGDKIIGLCGYNAGHRCKGKKASKKGLKYARKVVRMTALIENKTRSVKK